MTFAILAMFPVMWAVGGFFMWVVGDLARRRFLCGALLQMADNSGAGTIYILGGHSGFNLI